MDDTTRVLTTFLLSDLPDYAQELSIQHHSHFPSFSRLPSELRLTIWYLVLPKGKQVCLMNTEKTKRPRTQITPIGSRINKESRSETLRHYVILYQRVKKRGHPRCMIPMYFFDPKADVLQLDLQSVLCIRESVFWLKNLFDNNATALKSVKSIEIPIHPWKSTYDGVISPRDMEIDATQTLRHFHALERIILRCPKFFNAPRNDLAFFEPWDIRSLEASRKSFEDFYTARGVSGVKIVVMDGVGNVLK